MKILPPGPNWRKSIGLLLLTAIASTAALPPALEELPNLDRRVKVQPASFQESSQTAIAALRRSTPDVRIELDGRPHAKWIRAEKGFLADAQGRGVALATLAAFPTNERHLATKAFVQEHSAIFGFGPQALEQARIKREFTTPHNGLQTVVWEQELDGIAIFESVFISHTTKRGELVSVSSQFVLDPAKVVASSMRSRASALSGPAISAQTAVALAAQNIGEQLDVAGVTAVTSPMTNAERKQHFEAAALAGAAEARLVWLPIAEGELRLGWEVVLSSKARGEMFRQVVDVENGEVLIRHCLTEYISPASYRVFLSDSPSPYSPTCSTPCTTQPPVVAPVLVTLSALDTNASPNGWIDDGVNETRGNNVDAHTDRDANNSPDLPRPQGSPFRIFDFPIDLSLDPLTYTNAAVTDLFYWCNWMHDQLYALGFTEAAGNFQNNNFGRGGLGNDALQADAQDGSGVNNANMSTPSDGSPPRMQMYVFTGPTPDRDGDFDHEIVLHEYTHGLSNRRVGGGVGLSALQSRGMGEGWSDWYGLTLLSEPGDDVNGVYAAGGYATHLLSGLTANYYFGIRRYPYSTDMSKNPLTFKDIDPTQASTHPGVPESPLGGGAADQVHNQGEVWCVTLWEARANLIGKYGHAVGNQLILRLVTDGMNLSPSNPNFLQARDAILQADVVNSGGANLPELWAAFAKRGMGYSATSPSSSTTIGLVEAYDIPDNLIVTPGAGFTGIGPVGGPFSPNSTSFALVNIGTNAVNWSASATAIWLTISQSSGVIAAGGSNQVNVTVNPNANLLSAGVYNNTVRFTNVTSGVVHTRVFTLRVGQLDYFTELFDGGDNDLDNQTLTFTPDGSGSFYSVCREPAQAFPTDPTGGVNIALGGHTFTTLNLVSNISIYGTSASTIYLASEGHLTLLSGDSSGTMTLLNHFSRPRVSASLAHIHPIENGGTVSWLQLSNRVAITFNRVVEYSTTRTNSFQIELFYNGRIRMTHLQCATPTGLVGLSAGAGVPGDFIESNLSGYGGCAVPMVVTGPTNAVEGVGVLAGQVNIFSPAITNVIVTLTSSDTTEITVPATVTILAGTTSTNFNVTVVNDAELDGPQVATISATAFGYALASSPVTIADNETAVLSVNVPATVAEGVGSVQGSVQASIPPTASITVSLSSSDTTEIQVPPTVILPAGQTSAVFAITVVNDVQIDGAQSVNLTAQVPNWTSGLAAMTVNDNEPTNLVVLLPASAREGNGVLSGAGQVRIAGTLTTNLQVAMSSQDTTELTVPSFVPIIAGQTNASFNLTIVDDAVIDSSQVVTVVASAAGFANGSNNMTVTDDESPAEPFNPSPAHLATNIIQTADLGWQSGAVLGETITNDVYFGTTPAPGPAELIGTTTDTSWVLPTLLPQTTYYWQIVARKAGVTPGPVWRFTTRGLDHFEFSPVASPQYVSGPFSVTVTAKDAFGTTVSNFSGSVGLSGLTQSGTASVTSILFFENVNNHYVRSALDELGLVYQSFGGGSEAAFYTAVANANPASTLVVVDNASSSFSTSNSMVAFILAGGRMVLNYWDLDSAPVLAAAFNASLAGDLTAPLPVYDWGGSSLFAGLPNPINFVEQTWGDDGDRLNPIVGGKAVGGFVASTNSGQGAIIIGNAGRTILNGILFDDAQPGSNAVRLAKNEILAVLGNGGTVPITPTNSGNFVNGRWTGNLSVLQPVTNMFLRAAAGPAYTGDSNPFEVVLQNDVSISVADLPDPVSLGGNITYTINVTNIGPMTANGVVVTNLLSPGVSLVSAIPSQGSVQIFGGTVVCNLQSIGSNAFATVTIVATTISTGTLTNLTTVSRSGADAYPANNSAIVISAVQVPVVTINDVSLFEGNSGTTGAVFTVSVSPAPAAAVVVNFTTTGGTAISGVDFIATNGVLNFAVGQTNRSFVVPIVGDLFYESDETYTVNLSGVVNATLADSVGLGTIRNNDAIPMLSIGDVILTEGNFGTTNAIFPVTLSAASGVNVTVNYATASGNASSPSDYVSRSGSLTIPAGSISNAIAVTVNGDLTIESDEVFYVELSAVANATLLQREGYGLIVNDDGLPGGVDHFAWSPLAPTQYVGQPFPVTITALDIFENPAVNFTNAAMLAGLGSGGQGSNTILRSMVPNNSGSGNYTLGYSFTPTNDLTVTHVRSYFGTKVSIWTDAGVLLVAQPVSGSAGVWTDTALPSPLALTAGITYRVAAYTSGGNYYWRADGSNSFPNGNIVQGYDGTGDIFPTLIDTGAKWWAVDLRYTVGGVGSHPITPSVTGPFVNGVWSGNLTAFAPTTNLVLRADDGNGHTGTSGAMVIELRDDIRVTVSDSPDPVAVGANLTYSVVVTNTGPSAATSVVVTNQLPLGVTLVSVNPSQGVVITNGQTLICNLGTVNGGSQALISILVTPLAAGNITNIATVVRAGADNFVGNNFATNVTSVIVPSVFVTDASVVEGSGGMTNIAFTLSLSAASVQTISVNFATANNSAVAPGDYLSTNGTVVFAPGQTNRSVIVTGIGDSFNEPTETFLLNLSAAINANLGDNQAVGTILNDDPLPGIAINDVAVAEGNGGTTNAIFNVTLVPASGQSVSVSYNTANGTAISPSDYTATSGTLFFNPGETNKTVVVVVSGDITNELTETFNLFLNSPSNATNTDSQGLGTILNDDFLPTIQFAGAALALETCMPTNGAIDPGEGVVVNVSLANVSLGSALTTNLTVTLVSTGGIFSSSGPQNFGVLSPGGGAVSRPFTFTALGNCSDQLSAVLQLQDGGGNLGTVSFPVRLGKQSVSFAENFDTVTAPTLPAGWVANWSGAGSPWAITTVNRDTFPNAAFCPDPSSSSVNSLTSPSFVLTTTNAQLSFRHSYGTESCCDRCYLQVSINGGTFLDLNAAGGSFLTNGYLSGGWGGSSGGFITTIARLPASAVGQSVRLRWHFTSDSSVSGTGWYVDTIALSDGYACCQSDDLVMGVVDSPDPVAVGGTLTYSLLVTNPGPSMATGVTISNLLPAGVTFLSATSSQGSCTQFAGVVTCNLGALTSGTVATATILVAPGAIGTLTNVATVTRVEGDPNSFNNTVQALTAVVMPTLSISNLVVAEGNIGMVNASFSVNLTPPSGFPVTVNYATADGTALAGSDYAATNGVLNFAPGQTNLPIIVQVFGDTNTEPNEVFAVVLSNAVNANLGAAAATGTILNDEITGIIAYFTDNFPSSTGWAAPIVQAGFTPLQITDIAAFGLTNLDVLIIDEFSNGALSSPLLARLPAIQSWVGSGGKLIIHDRSAGNQVANPFLLGTTGITTVRYTTADLDVIPPGTNIVAAGPNGTINNSTLDGGSSSAHGYVTQSQLPTGAFPIVSIGGVSTNVVCFSYPLGNGLIYYSSIPLDCYLGTGDCVGNTISVALRTIYAPNVLAYVSTMPGGVSFPPTITTQPTNQTVLAGVTATFSVAASGTSLEYHWRKDSSPLANQTNATLTLVNVQTNDAGTYSVIVSNGYGSVTSSNALLTVLALPPAIISQPTNRIAMVGNPTTFSVTASGNAPLRYQWRKDNVAIAGGTNNSFAINAVAYSNAGNYSVVVSNAYGYTNSAAATLTVVPYTSNLTFAAYDTGWYSAAGSHTPGNANYYVGDSATTPNPPLRNWFAFNVPQLSGVVLSAQLRVNTYNITSPTGTETLQLRHVSTPVATLVAGGSGLVSIYNDLGDGVVYGSRSFATNEASQFITMNLNADFIANLIAKAGQPLAIGGEIITLDGIAFNNEAIFATSLGIANDVQLLITLGSNPAQLKFLDPDLIAGRLRLRISTVDESHITPNRASNIWVYASTNIALPLSNWTALAIPPVLTNGLLLLDGINPTNPPAQFFRAIEGSWNVRPLRLHLPQASGNGLTLRAGAGDGSPLTPIRAAKIRFFMSTNVALPFGSWQPLLGSPVLSNGVLQVTSSVLTNVPTLYFRAEETP